ERLPAHPDRRNARSRVALQPGRRLPARRRPAHPPAAAGLARDCPICERHDRTSRRPHYGDPTKVPVARVAGGPTEPRAARMPGDSPELALPELPETGPNSAMPELRNSRPNSGLSALLKAD